jgi:integrase
MKQPSHFFNLEAKKNKNNKHLILFNLTYGYKKYNQVTNSFTYPPFRISTKWSIEKEYWNDKPIYRANQTFVKKYGKDLNNILDDIEKIAYNQLSIYRNENNEDPRPEVLKLLVLEKLGRIEKTGTDIAISEYIEKLISHRTTLANTSSEFWDIKTGNQYQLMANRIKSYENTKNIKLTFETITEELYWDYFKTINDLKKLDDGSYYTQSSMNKEFRSLRAVFNCALSDHIKINIAFSKKSLKIPAYASSYETYLTEEQLQTIIKTDVSHSKEFQHARNYIILSSFLGLRIGDMKFLNELLPEKIVHQSVKYDCITTRIRKSKENTQELITIIPLLKPVKDLLAENNNLFPKFPSDSNTNKYIKKFLKHLEFKDVVITKTKYYLVDEVLVKNKEQHTLFSAHDCRRTFITNLKQIGIQNDTIEPITHPKIKYTSVLDGYDKSTLIDKAVKLINQLKSKNSSLFKY